VFLQRISESACRGRYDASTSIASHPTRYQIDSHGSTHSVPAILHRTH